MFLPSKFMITSLYVIIKFYYDKMNYSSSLLTLSVVRNYISVVNSSGCRARG